MNASFFKFHAKSTLATVVKSLVVGASFGAAAFGGLFLTMKLLGMDISVLWYVLAGVGPAIVAGGTTFLLVRRSNKKLAKELDKEYALHEAVQTMLEFEGEEGDIIKIQREAAEEKLNKLTPAFSFKKIWQYVLIPVLCASIFVSGMVVPKKVIPAEEEPIIELDDFSERSLRELIANVRESKLEQGLKQNVLSSLEELLELVLQPHTNTAMQAAVRETIEKVDQAIDVVNSYRIISKAMSENEKTTIYATTNRNVVTRYVVEASGAVQTYDQVNKIDNVLKGSIEGLVATDEYIFRATFSSYANYIAEHKGYEFAVYIQDIALAVESCLESEELSATDSLVTVYKTYATALHETYTYIEHNYGDAYEAKIVPAINTLCQGLVDNLYVQSYNAMMDDYIRNTLAYIFKLEGMPNKPGVSEGEVDPSDKDSEEIGGDGPSEGENQGSGGLANQQTHFGSNETIYDPVTKQYVAYGEYFRAYYYPILDELINSGEISEELAESLANYVELLLSTGKTEA